MRWLWLLALCASGVAQAAGYPGTCFPERFRPLPDPQDNEPFIASGVVDLRTTPTGFTRAYSYSVYRVACPGGGAAVLLRLKSVGIPSAEAPTLTLIQGAVTESQVRYSTEPYTLREGVARGENVDLGRVVVLNSNRVDFTKAMVLRIEGASAVTVNIPDFDPALYPEASQSLLIYGYASGSYYNPQRSGEGLLVEVGAAQLVVVTWFSFDQSGAPFWLVGAAHACPSFSGNCPQPGRYAEVELRAFKGGGFAGQFDPSRVSNRVWGKARLEWTNCSTLRIQLTQTHTATDLPTASGELVWTRLTSIEYAGC